MTTADHEASTVPAGVLRRSWEKIAIVLAVIGLVDVSSQLIKWAASIHWIATKYAIVRAWLFGWLPFHIPPEWHDPIVLFLIILSVTNVGVYRETGPSIRSFRNAWNKFPLIVAFLPLVFTFAVIFYIEFNYLPDNNELYRTALRAGIPSTAYKVFIFIVGLSTLFLLMVILAFLGMAFIVARRWVLTTAAILVPWSPLTTPTSNGWSRWQSTTDTIPPPHIQERPWMR
jgi:hypothetical protein